MKRVRQKGASIPGKGGSAAIFEPPARGKTERSRIFFALLFAVLLALFFGACQVSEASEDCFPVSIQNQCESTITGVEVDYYVGRQLVGSCVATGTKGPVPVGDSMVVWLKKEGPDMTGYQCRLCVTVAVIVETGEAIPASGLYEWDANPNQRYDFTLTGSEETGFALTPASQAA